MSNARSQSLASRYGARIAALNAALTDGDEAAFTAALDDLLHTRKPTVLNDLRDLTANLKVALDRFRLDARLADFAEKDMPDARQRLAHVLNLTDQAAHRTLDLVEKSGPPAERMARSASALAPAWSRFRARTIEVGEYREMLTRLDAFLPAAQADADSIRRSLSEVLLTQGYQDLTGQIIRGVIDLVRDVESALADLARITGIDPEPADTAATTNAHGHGPVVPGVTRGEVASGQQDVDALLSGFGM